MPGLHRIRRNLEIVVGRLVRFRLQGGLNLLNQLLRRDDGHVIHRRTYLFYRVVTGLDAELRGQIERNESRHCGGVTDGVLVEKRD